MLSLKDLEKVQPDASTKKVRKEPDAPARKTYPRWSEEQTLFHLQRMGMIARELAEEIDAIYANYPKSSKLRRTIYAFNGITEFVKGLKLEAVRWGHDKVAEQLSDTGYMCYYDRYRDQRTMADICNSWFRK